MCDLTKHNHKKALFLFEKGTVQLTSSSNDTSSPTEWNGAYRRRFNTLLIN